VARTFEHSVSCVLISRVSKHTRVGAGLSNHHHLMCFFRVGISIYPQQHGHLVCYMSDTDHL